MWTQYKKTLIPMQLPIIAACVTMRVYRQMPWVSIVLFFCVMQLGALLGAALGARMRRQIERRDDPLPLQRRR